MSLLGGIRTRLDTMWGGDLFGAYGLIWTGDNLSSMRDRSRRLEENNVLAYGVLDRAVENVIGTGIRCRAATGVKSFDDQANEYWKELTDGTRFDVRRMHSWGQMQRLVYRAKKRDGDVGVALIDDGFGPELQIVEGQDIESPLWAMTPNIINGVEFNAFTVPVAYWVRQIDEWGTITHRRVEARDMIFLHDHFRYGVARGVPAFNGAFSLFDMIVGYLDATVVAARVGASTAMLAETDNPAGELARRANGRTSTEPNGEVGATVPIYAGMINYVKPGLKLTAFNPSQPLPQFPDAIRTFSRFVGLKFGLTIERVLLDFSKANYSVSRSTVLQETKTAEVEQDDIYQRFLGRAWRWAISKGVKANRFTGEIPANYWKHEWMPQGRPLVEPSKDAPGLKILVDNQLESIKNLCEERGYDWQQIAKDNAEAIKLFQELGLGQTAAAKPPAPDATKPIFSDVPITDDDEKEEKDDDAEA